MVNDKRAALRGFTVVELIVAMSISAIVLLSGYELFRTLRGVSDSQQADMAAMVEIVRSLNRVREDLLHALPRMESQEPIFTGSDPSLDDGAETPALLEFYSLCPGGGDARLHGLRQMQRITYELVKDPGSLRLYRSATPVISPGQASNDERREQVLDRLEHVEIAFYTGQSREPRFSSNEELPIGVDLIVRACGQTWPLSVKLPCGSRSAPQ